MFKICDEPESPNEEACLRFLMNCNRHMEGACSHTHTYIHIYIYIYIYICDDDDDDGPESPNVGVYDI